MGQRYSIVGGNHEREIVLLKSFPCKYGKCSFCNYILDNSTDEEEIIAVNKCALAEVTGKVGVLEVVNSGSVFELPKTSIEDIKSLVIAKNIHTLYFEIYYGYKNKLQEIRDFFSGINIRFRMGLETFDNDFRINVYKKRFSLHEKDYQYLGKELFSVCLLVCVNGQTKEMIDNDIELGLKYFKSITINVFVNNDTAVTRDEELYQWFVAKYSYLQENPRVELLITNKELGVFEQ